MYSSKCPHHPAHGSQPFSCRPETRQRLLDALEVFDRVNRPQLADLTGLGTMTVHRAVDQLLHEDILTEMRSRHPVTGRMTYLLYPICPFPVLLVDLTGEPAAAYLVGGTQTLDTQSCVRVDRRRRDIFSPEDDLRQLLSDTHGILPGNVTHLHPALLMPDTGTTRGLSAARSVQIIVEETNAYGLSLVPDGSRRDPTSVVRVMTAEPAAVYAAVRDPAVHGKRSLLIVRQSGCRLLVRSQPDGDWFSPPLLDGFSRAMREALVSLGGNAEPVRTLLSAVTPEAVICDADTSAETAALLCELLPDGVPVKIAGSPLPARGILLRARMDLWTSRTTSAPGTKNQPRNPADSMV